MDLYVLGEGAPCVQAVQGCGVQQLHEFLGDHRGWGCLMDERKGLCLPY